MIRGYTSGVFDLFPCWAFAFVKKIVKSIVIILLLVFVVINLF